MFANGRVFRAYKSIYGILKEITEHSTNPLSSKEDDLNSKTNIKCRAQILSGEFLEIGWCMVSTVGSREGLKMGRNKDESSIGAVKKKKNLKIEN